MSEASQQAMRAGQRGRPRRKAKPILIRGTVPENHALAPMLAGMSPARACTMILELARLQMTQDVEAPSLRLNSPSSQAKLDHQPAPASEVEEEPFDAIRDLVGFTGVPAS